MNRPLPTGMLPAETLPDAAPDPARTRARPLMRRYEALARGEDGAEVELNRLAPATGFFESAFNAMARGTLVTTPQGPVAVEDLRPGDFVETAEGGAEPILWRGSLTLYPLRPGLHARPDRLYRCTADALGYGRPIQDLLLGPGALVWSPRAGDFLPAEALLDGETVIELTPPGAVTAFHLCLAGSRTLLANGVALRSFAPDAHAAAHLAPELLALFVSLFPNAAEIADIAALPLPRRPAYPQRPGSAVA